MALTPLNWKMLPPKTVTTVNIHGILDAIYQCGNQTTYVDGTTKSSSATSWTWSRDNTNTLNPGFTTAVYASPTTPNPSLFTQSVIIIASSGTPVAIKYSRTGEALSSTRIMAGCAKQSGAYSNWNTVGTYLSGSGTPFTSGQFTGYSSIGGISLPSTGSTVMMFESQEAVAVFVLNSGGAIIGGLFSGAFIDPLSTDVANAESDGRLYGVSTLGYNATPSISPTWLSAGGGAGYQDILNYYASGSPLPTACTFIPGSGSIRYFSRLLYYQTPSSSFLSPAGDIPRIPIQIAYIASGITGFSGQLREIYATRSGAMGSCLYELGTIHGYFVSQLTGSFNEAVLLKA